MIINDIMKSLASQPSHANFLPKISQHVTHEIVHFNDGYFAFVFRFDGIPFESESDSTIFTQFLTLARSFAAFGKNYGDRLGLWTTVQRRERTFDRHYHFDNIFCQQFADKYLDKFNKDHFFQNQFFMSFILKYEDYEDGLKEVLDLKNEVQAALSSYGTTILKAYKNEHDVMFSQVYSFLGSLINYEWQEVPLSNIDCYETLGHSDLHFGFDVLEIRGTHAHKFATLYDLKDFGISRPKTLTGILDLPCEFTLTQSFVYIQNTDILQRIKKQQNNLKSVNDQADHQFAELEAAKGDITAGELMFGDYHGSLIVYGDTAKEAVNNGTTTAARFLNTSGFFFKKATMSAPISYFSQVVGAKHKPRQSPKSSLNLATSFGMHNYSHGKEKGNPIGDGTAIMPLQTVSRTVFDFNFHFTNPKEDNVGDKIAGHTLILGATGTGKTTLETALLTFTNRFKPHMFILDLDQGMKIFMQALGGSYYTLESGVPTGLNPFQLPDNPYNREFIYGLVGICGRDNNGQLSAEEEKQIKVAVDTLFNQVSFEHRNFSVLLQNIPMTANRNSLRERLARWCASENGRFAWCLDNPTNKFNPEEFYLVGFDLTDVLRDNFPPTEPILAYMFYLRQLMMDKVAERNGILCTVVEEFWWPTRFAATQEFILKILKTDRKRGGWIVLTSQSPEDAINSPIFAAIIQQTPTKIFLPNPDAEYKDSYEKCGITEKECAELKKLSLDSRTFLVKQSKQSAFAKLDLYGFKAEMAVLSGASSNIEILDNLLATMPNATPEQWYPLFKEKMLKQ